MNLQIKNIKKTRKNHKYYIVASSIASLLASGSAGGGSPKIQEELKSIGDVQGDAPSQGNDTITLGADGKNTEVATGGGDDNVKGGSGNDIMQLGSGNDVGNGGGGDDKIYGGDGVDLLRGGTGNDEIYGGAGHDHIVVIGVSLNGQYTSSDISNPNGTGIDLSKLITLDEINNHAVSDVANGGSIDGEADGATLFIFGDVDLSNVKLSNITIIEVQSTLIISAAQLIDLINNGFTVLTGDDSSHLVIKDSVTAVTIDLSGVDMSHFAHLTLGANVKIIVDQADIATITTIDGGGTLQASADTGKLVIIGKDIGANVSILDSTGAEAAYFPMFNNGLPASVEVAENSTAVGTFAATDVNGDAIAYSVAGTDGAEFSIDANGVLSFIAAPDYEYGQGIYNINIIATANGDTVFHPLVVNVTGVNEYLPTFQGSLITSYTFDEPDYYVGYFVAWEGDKDDFSSYSILGTDADDFKVDAHGKIEFIAPTDFENPTDSDLNNRYEFTLRATDTFGIFSEIDIDVTITNGIENPNAPVFLPSLSHTVTNAEEHSFVGNFIAADFDSDPIKYSVTGWDAQAFYINENTGSLHITNIVDYELPQDVDRDNIYEISVWADDGFHATEFELIVNITDIDETPILYGDANANTINLGDGNDTYYGLGGADVITPGKGLDIIKGGDGLDILNIPLFSVDYHIRKFEGKIDIIYQQDSVDSTDTIHAVEYINLASSGIDITAIWFELSTVEQDNFTDQSDYIDWLADVNGYDYFGL